MGTVTVQSAGFAALPSTVPTHWPSNLVWPVGGSINGIKTYTISDSDAQQLVSWIATAYNSTLAGTATPPVTITAVSIVLAWLNGFMTATTNATQQQQTLPVTVPPPIVIS